MYKELYQFLIQYKQLPVPGIGTFLLERRSAAGDFYNKKIDPPVYTIAFQKSANSPSPNFFKLLAGVLNITNEEAATHFNDFIFDMGKKISAGDVINWNSVGSLSRGLVGEIKFTPIVVKELFFDQSVAAEKMIREKAEHTVRVGEDERTSTEMTEILNQPVEKKEYWWNLALVIALLSIMFIGWYFSEHGLNVSSTANQEKVAPFNPATTSNVLK